MRKALDILVRSVSGRTAAHVGSASRPRGVLFPTGVGKTELAKGLTKLIFDDERLYIRLDMSEFSAEHAADRLIGAPPGYTGYERGGELTDIRPATGGRILDGMVRNVLARVRAEADLEVVLSPRARALVADECL